MLRMFMNATQPAGQFLRGIFACRVVARCSSAQENPKKHRLSFVHPTTLQPATAVVAEVVLLCACANTLLFGDERKRACITEPAVQATGAGIETATTSSRGGYVEDRDKGPCTQQVLLGNRRRASEKSGAHKGRTTAGANSCRAYTRSTGNCHQIPGHYRNSRRLQAHPLR